MTVRQIEQIKAQLPEGETLNRMYRAIEGDRFVPCAMGREIATANPGMIELETFPDAGHGLSFLVDRPRYERLVTEFFRRVIPEK